MGQWSDGWAGYGTKITGRLADWWLRASRNRGRPLQKRWATSHCTPPMVEERLIRGRELLGVSLMPESSLPCPAGRNAVDMKEGVVAPGWTCLVLACATDTMAIQFMRDGLAAG